MMSKRPEHPWRDAILDCVLGEDAEVEFTNINVEKLDNTLFALERETLERENQLRLNLTTKENTNG